MPHTGRSLRALGLPAIQQARRWQHRLGALWGRNPVQRALQQALSERLDLTRLNGRQRPDGETALVSRVVGAQEILSSEYAQLAGLLGEVPRPHRKQWEFVSILRAGLAAEVIAPGKSALGFGVGREPITSALAAAGVQVLATDQPVSTADHWMASEEHASELRALWQSSIVDRETFEALVRFLPVDMNHLPEGLGRHDLLWSACVIEHLGSPAAGLSFLERSLELLKPGGVAVHTTELELTERRTTADYGHCAVYRLDDLLDLQEVVAARGYSMQLDSFVPMETAADRFIAPPLSLGSETYHLKLALYDSITTSVALIIRAPN